MSIADPAAVRVEREISAVPEEVYAAWIDPESMQTWMAPDPMTVGEVSADPRVGGAYKIVMVDSSGAVEHHGTYEELDPPKSIVFTWRAAHLGDSVSRVHITLTPIEGGTRMVLEHQLLPAEQHEGHRQGWTSIAKRLAAALGDRR
jgi:uncharacterized protein YndB with AHSA1/START domain